MVQALALPRVVRSAVGDSKETVIHKMGRLFRKRRIQVFRIESGFGLVDCRFQRPKASYAARSAGGLGVLLLGLTIRLEPERLTARISHYSANWSPFLN